MPPRLSLCARWKRWEAWSGILAVFAGIAVSAPARGDLGVLVADGNAGPYRVSVLVAPVPVRAGPSQWSVLVQDAGGNPVDAVEVSLEWQPPDPHAGILRVATPGRHPFYRSSNVMLPKTATWRVGVRVRGDEGSGRLAFDIHVAPRLGTWRTYWPALLVPALALVLFLVHQFLKLREPRVPRSREPRVPRSREPRVPG